MLLTRQMHSDDKKHRSFVAMFLSPVINGVQCTLYLNFYVQKKSTQCRFMIALSSTVENHETDLSLILLKASCHLIRGIDEKSLKADEVVQR